MTNLDSTLKSRDITLPTKVRLVKAMVFPVVIYGCESWTVKKAECQRIYAVVLEKTLESPFDCKEIQPVYLKRDQPWVFFGRNDAKAETPVLWPPHAKSWLIGKDSDAGRDWGQEEKGMTEDEMAGWHHQLPEFTDSRPSSQWCHPAISCSVVPFSSCPQSLPASESFPISQLFAWGGQSTGVSASASFLPKNMQDWSPLGWTGWISLPSMGLSRVFSNTTVQKHQFFGAQPSSQSNSHIHTWPLEKP